MTSQQQSNQKTKKVVGLSSLYGFARGCVGFPIEHPLEAVKTQWQANPSLKNEISIVKSIYQKKGVNGFYSGSLPNLGRILIKNTYRFPLMVGLPVYYEQNLPNYIAERKQLLKLCTGCSISLFESIILCPFERMRTYFMTTGSSKRATFSQYFFGGGQPMKDLFRGFGGLLMRQCISWNYFLQADLYLKNKVRTTYDIPNDQKLSGKMLFGVSLLISATQTIIIMPFDALKTQQQLFNRSGQDKLITYSEIAAIIQKEAGIRGFFVGWRLRFTMYLINTLFGVTILEKMDQMMKNSKN